MRREDDDEKRARKKRTKSTHATAISSASSASIAAACPATLLERCRADILAVFDSRGGKGSLAFLRASKVALVFYFECRVFSEVGRKISRDVFVKKKKKKKKKKKNACEGTSNARAG